MAVHLAPGVGGFKRDVRYYKGADFIYLQIGDHIHGDFVADSTLAVNMLKEAMKLGIPVVANEYSAVSESATARALGDLLCQNGAVGTGNGRNMTLCGQRTAKKKEWYQEYEKELIVSGIAAVTLFVMLNNDDMSSEMFQLYADDNGYELGFKSGDYNLRYSEDKVMATYKVEF